MPNTTDSFWPYRLADASLYRHRAFDLLPDDEDHPIDQAAIERARENALDALDSGDPVNALADYGWESDAYLQPADGDRGGHLDTLLLQLISDVRRLREQGRENEAQHEAYRRVLSLADRIADHHAASVSGQRVALDQLADRWINSCMDVAGV